MDKQNCMQDKENEHYFITVEQEFIAPEDDISTKIDELLFNKTNELMALYNTKSIGIDTLFEYN